jgi:hypothetical protein
MALLSAGARGGQPVLNKSRLPQTTYTFASLTLHPLQRVYRDWNERVREFLQAGGGRLKGVR